MHTDSTGKPCKFSSSAAGFTLHNRLIDESLVRELLRILNQP